jgi:hypothetical protein
MAGRKWGLAKTFPLMLGGAIVVGVIGVGVTSYMDRAGLLAASTAEVRPETLVGEPCPVLTPEAYAARPVKAKQGFSSNDIRYERRFGHVECSVIAARKGATDFIPVCQFSGPSLLTVTTAKGTFYFAPGTGKPATVMTRDGVPSCVLASNFKSGG